MRPIHSTLTLSGIFEPQMRRWARSTKQKPDDMVIFRYCRRRVIVPDIYLNGRRLLVDEGMADESGVPWEATVSKRRTTETDIIDGVSYDGRAPQRLHRRCL